MRLPLYRAGEVVAYTEIDPEFAHLAQYRWFLGGHDGRWYAYCAENRPVCSRWLHRVVLGVDRHERRTVDHINGDTLDNRRANLRLATTAENAQNQGSRGGTSTHRGVSWCRTRRKWLAQATLNGRKYNLGRYDSEAEAADAAAGFRREHMPFSQEAA